MGVGEGERKGAWLALSPLSMHLAHSSIHLWAMGCGRFTLAQCGSLSGTTQVVCATGAPAVPARVHVLGRVVVALYVRMSPWRPHSTLPQLLLYKCTKSCTLSTYIHRFIVGVAGGCGDAHCHVCDAHASFAERSTVPVLAFVRSLCLSGCIACNISVFKLPHCTT